MAEILSVRINLVDNAPETVADYNQACVKCAKPMGVRFGRYGYYLACAGFPNYCNNTQHIPEDILSGLPR